MSDRLEIDQVENAYGEAVATGKHGDDFLAALTESLNRALAPLCGVSGCDIHRQATPPASAERDAVDWEATHVVKTDPITGATVEVWERPPASAERDAVVLGRKGWVLIYPPHQINENGEFSWWSIWSDEKAGSGKSLDEAYYNFQKAVDALRAAEARDNGA